MIRFEGERVLVTGASRGLGLAIAVAFARAGATVHMLAAGPEIGPAAAGLGATAHRADITDAAAVGSALEGIGRLDVLVNNAGLERLTPVEDTGAEALATFRRIVETNVTGTAIVTGRALPLLPPGGRIINTASVWGRVAEPLYGAAVASKHAVIGLTKVWARELGPRGIRVNAVCPGRLRTEAALRSARELAERTGRSEAMVIAAVEAAQALPGGMMTPEEVVGPYLYLASPLAASVTGQTLGIDRGEMPW